MLFILVAGLGAFVAFLYAYIRLNDAKLEVLPPEATKYSPERFTPESTHAVAEKLKREPISVKQHLPLKTGRRYIVIGGAGFLGGWIVLQLIERGEDPRRIRILDIRQPTRPDLLSGPAKSVAFFKVDVSDSKAVDDAFTAPWPLPEEDAHTTVFHTAANIRFYERHLSLLPRSTRVNEQGVQNVISAAKAIGASAMVYTSSGSVAVRRSRFWLWPWEREPAHFVQLIDDNDALVPTRHDDFFSNYAASKIRGERAVRAAHLSPTSKDGRRLRTGCVRPGNGVFGPGGDILCGAYLVRKHNPTWVNHILHSFVYIENCALAHLQYEACLLASSADAPSSSGSASPSRPDVGGQAFTITDAGPPMTYGDAYTALNTLDPETVFPRMSSTAMLLLAQLFEAIYLTRAFLTAPSAPPLVRALARALVPDLDGDVVNLQPPLFALTSVHLVFDDSRARRAPEQGGIGYSGPYTSLQGLCRTAEDYFKAGQNGEERSMSGGVSFGFGMVKAQRGVDKVQRAVEKGAETIPN
ncbi:NAD(P)-binding protein [Coniophora puteana RWD-64-598 SS2]|uniref:NAD(P)-binding protein n=1 Tax=Coniophora puteana (strain RWD-64-598) TaxID=741705 RepID=A0A5M3MDU9_CONPW|nr:NAD(P)-binding protein [Coniophora puteana RWD-64-598 SS2]EIW77217.1 NAD(P)-binding protein [Coniophora puteana RWD-64-598 SS2]